MTIVKNYILPLLIMVSPIFTQPSILIMNPEPNSEISGKDILIAVSIFGMSDINPDNILSLIHISEPTRPY